MNYIHLVYPKNPNLKHCPTTFAEALVREFGLEQVQVDKISKINFTTSIRLIKQLIAIDIQEIGRASCRERVLMPV